MNRLRALWFGTYDRGHPRNAQAIAALRRAGIAVTERHADPWRGRDRVGGPLGAFRILAAEVRLMLPRRKDFDLVVVGYPGHFDVPQARSLAGRKPLVFVPRVSLVAELIERRGAFKRRSMTARLLEVTDARALQLPDLIVADTESAADHLARAADVARERIAIVFAGAEERVFREEWSPIHPFGALHVAVDGPSYATVVEAASLVPELPVRIVGRDDGATADNVEWLTTPYDDLGIAFAHAGIAIGSLADDVVIPDAAFQALATGTPLVTADTAAARELLVDGESALLVEPMDAGALAAALEQLAQDETLRLRLSQEGRRVYEERASEEVLGAQWRALLEPLGQTGTA